MVSHEFVLLRFREQFGAMELESINPDKVLEFLSNLTEGKKQTTKRIRYASLKTFFNFIKNAFNEEFQNPCEAPILRKIFRVSKPFKCTIFDKDVIDEIIFRIDKPRDRLLLELMARGGMRVGEVLKLRPIDIDDRKIIIVDPKSGKELEVVFIPQKIADRLKDYIREKGIDSHDRIISISYSAARIIVKRAGMMVNIDLKPHDLRRHAATYASRSGTPIEIVSKVILRHSNLSTTQRYLGKVSDQEALRWIENLYG